MRVIQVDKFGPELVSPPKLSVVVPIGAMAGRLGALIGWVVEIQEYSSEVILVVDEKLDGTYSELRSLMEKIRVNQPITIINAECNGPGAARNLGKKSATGIWMAFWDSDDQPIIRETYNAIEAASQTTEAIICRYDMVSREGTTRSPSLSDHQIALNPGIWRFIWKREKFDHIDFPNLRLAEDQVFLVESNVFACALMKFDKSNYRYINSGVNQLTGERKNLPDLLIAISCLADLYFHGHLRNSKSRRFFLIIFTHLIFTSLQRRFIQTIMFLLRNPRMCFIPLNATIQIRKLRDTYEQ